MEIFDGVADEGVLDVRNNQCLNVGFVEDGQDLIQIAVVLAVVTDNHGVGHVGAFQGDIFDVRRRDVVVPSVLAACRPADEAEADFRVLAHQFHIVVQGLSPAHHEDSAEVSAVKPCTFENAADHSSAAQGDNDADAHVDADGDTGKTMGLDEVEKDHEGGDGLKLGFHHQQEFRVPGEIAAGFVEMIACGEPHQQGGEDEGVEEEGPKEAGLGVFHHVESDEERKLPSGYGRRDIGNPKNGADGSAQSSADHDAPNIPDCNRYGRKWNRCLDGPAA